ncbi:hypothetical protein [Bacillus sp. Marseille-P3800]|uniref:hypothetical protein n=1 Tax=Bacillus sp. Marseille-P3800 TaxID=2014782 RepID=UPI000C071C9D|nr:hypothetical protein [Bacillus sp. Marseille-P3800]
MKIEPCPSILAHWTRTYVPHRDYFFLKKDNLSRVSSHLTKTIVMDRKSFFSHPSYTQIGLTSALETWQLSNEVDTVIIAEPNWLEQICELEREWIIKLQIRYNRGLIIPAHYFPEQIVETSYLSGSKVAVQSRMWYTLPLDQRMRILSHYAQDWDTWITEPSSTILPRHIEKTVNHFPTTSGPNCLSATIYAITAIDWHKNEWFHEEPFQTALAINHYKQHLHNEIKPTDVLIWRNEEGAIIHASYCVSHQLFFNKNGQTLFHPWKLVSLSSLEKLWGQHYVVYRKENL